MYEPINKATFYPLVDFHPLKLEYPRGLKARWIREFRTPKKGEWYLSGAIIEAYQAKRDMHSPFYIAQILIVESVASYQIKRIIE